MKRIVLLIVLTFFVLYSCGDDKDDKKENLDNLIDDYKDDSSNVDDIKSIKDDCSWIAIIGNKKISTEDFNRFFKLMMASPDNRSQQHLNTEKLKNYLAKQFVNIETAYRKAIKDKIFSDEELKLQKKLFAKQGLVQYYFFKKIVGKSSKPSDEKLKKFYKAVKSELQSFGIKSYEDNKDAIQNYYMLYKIKSKQDKLLEKLKLENTVIENDDNLIEKWLNDNLASERLLDKNKEENWIFKINDEKFYLKDFVKFVNLEVKIKMPPWQKKEINESKEARKEYKDYMKQVVLGPQGFYNQYKSIQLVFLKAREENIHRIKEAEAFMKLMTRKEIAQRYLEMEIMNKLKRPTDKMIEKAYKMNKEKIEKRLKQLGMTNLSKDIIKRKVEQEIVLEQQEMIKKELMDKIKGEQKIRISECFFEKEFDDNIFDDTATDKKEKTNNKKADKSSTE